MNYPQQPPYQQHNPGQAASANIIGQVLNGPRRQRANHPKPPDGSHVVRLLPGTKMNNSQKDGQPYLLLEYQVVESSVQQAIGQVYASITKLVSRQGLESVAELARTIFGVQYAQQLVAHISQTQPYVIPQAVAHHIAQTIQGGNYFAYVVVRRSQKQIQERGYENAFPNHDWLLIEAAPLTLATAQQKVNSMMPAGAPQAAPAPQQQPWQPQPPAPGAAPQASYTMPPPQQPWQQQPAPPPSAPPWQQPAAAPQPPPWQQPAMSPSAAPTAPPGPAPVPPAPWQQQPAQPPAAPQPGQFPAPPQGTGFPPPPAFPQR